MRLSSALILLTLLASSAAAQDVQEFACEGPFGPDTSQARLAETFGAQNVTFAQIAGDEGTYPEATVIFPTVPAKRLSIVWQGEGTDTPNFLYIGEDSAWTVQGLRVGMSIAEVEQLNGGPFMLGGFNDMERGGVADWQGGKLTLSSGPCRIDVQFSRNQLGVPLTLNDPLESEGPYSSQTPAYRELGAKIGSFTIYYPWEL